MGLPQHPEVDGAQPAETSTSNAAATPNKVSELPEAAIELATKLFDFARQGKEAELTQYVKAGIPANLTNGKGDTLLMLAAYHGHAGTVRMLLENGADANVFNDRGQSPIAGAVFKAHDDVVKVLFEGVAGMKADIRAGQPNAVDTARMFKKEDYLEMFGVQE